MTSCVIVFFLNLFLNVYFLGNRLTAKINNNSNGRAFILKLKKINWTRDENDVLILFFKFYFSLIYRNWYIWTGMPLSRQKNADILRYENFSDGWRNKTETSGACEKREKYFVRNQSSVHCEFVSIHSYYICIGHSKDSHYMNK